MSSLLCRLVHLLALGFNCIHHLTFDCLGFFHRLNLGLEHRAGCALCAAGLWWRC